MKNNIVGVGMEFSQIDFPNIDLISFDEYTSLLDYDIVIIDLNNLLIGYAFDKPYQGKRNLDKHSSLLFMDDFKRRKKEITELFELGKTIYAILPIEKEFYVYTGGQKYSGTGKKRQIMNMVKNVNILDTFPTELQLMIGMGSKISATSDDFYDRLFGIKDIEYSYNYCFEPEETGIPLAFIANTKNCISKAFMFGEGHLIVIPPIFEAGLYQTDEVYLKAINSFLQTIDNFQEELKSNLVDVSLPDWTKKYLIFNEAEMCQKLETMDVKMKTLMNEKEQIKNQLHEVQKYKLVLTTSGKELEKIVFEMLEEMGFVEHQIEKNKLFFSLGEENIVVNVQGVIENSTEKHAAQLEKRISEIIETTDLIPKGILIVNAFKNQDISLRSEKIFSNQMLEYSMKRNHCLLSTTQFLCLYIMCKNNPEKKEKLIEEFIHSVGIYNQFENWTDFLVSDNK